MSEQINNREYRKGVIKQVITQLHEGKSVDEVKAKFEEAFAGVSATEISEVEQALISEGLPVSEVQRLCDVHAAVFKDSIEEIHQTQDAGEISGHPVNVLKLENRHIERLIEDQIKPLIEELDEQSTLAKLRDSLKSLAKIDLHYSRKENLLFPYMEKYGITAPPKVMWGVDDEIRAELKEIISLLSQGAPDLSVIKDKLSAVLNKITEMIFKEENILLPMLLETLAQGEWRVIANESDEIGFMIASVPTWAPANGDTAVAQAQPQVSGNVRLPSGVFKTEELTHMLNALPFDITFVDKNDVVKYFSQSAERIFARTKAIIGRDVSNCHPPSSVHVVEDIVQDFKSGKKDHEDFWIRAKDRFIYIRYFAVREDRKSVV